MHNQLNGEADASWAAEEMLDSDGNMKTGEEAEKLAVTSAAIYAGSIDTVRLHTAPRSHIVLL